MTTTHPVKLREHLVGSLQFDMIRPTGSLGNHKEIVRPIPSRSYLNGFLVPAPSRTQGMTPSEGQRGLEFEDG